MKKLIVLCIAFISGCSHLGHTAYVNNEKVVCPDARAPLCYSEYGPFGSSRLGRLVCTCQY